jgi:hypothetical protein
VDTFQHIPNAFCVDSLQCKARRGGVDMIVEGIRARATNSCENEHEHDSRAASSSECNKDVL